MPEQTQEHRKLPHLVATSRSGSKNNNSTNFGARDNVLASNWKQK